MKDTISVQNLSEAIGEASKCINSLYPLSNFIACNALKGFENIPFVTAMREARELHGAKGFLALSDYRAMYESGRISPSNLEEAFQNAQKGDLQSHNFVTLQLSVAEMFDLIGGSELVAAINRQMIKWCGSYLDRTQAQWKPEAPPSLFRFWKDLAGYDLSMWWFGVRNWSQSVDLLPDRSQESLEILLNELGVRSDEIVPYLKRHIIQLPGFASYLKWCELENGQDGILCDYLAIRLHYEKMLAQVTATRQYRCADLALVKPLLNSELTQALPESMNAQEDYGFVWQDAYELNYRNRLLSSLTVEAPTARDTACCQMVFCIDVRSEPIRRRIEQLGPYSTYGFAGFFGMPMRLTEFGSALSLDLCPVLLKPEKQVVETTNTGSATHKNSWQALKVAASQLKKRLKCNLAGAFGLVEMFGLWAAPPLVAKTFLPAKIHAVCSQFEQEMEASAKSKLDLSSFSLAEKAALAEGALKGIGLTHFGKVIVLCGHKSSSTNNPYASSLDCGACGGNGGGFSARLAAEILNEQSVRESLSSRGWQIPTDTIFVAAEHDTTTDQFRFFDPESLAYEHGLILGKLKEDLVCAGESLRRHRAQTLPQTCLSPLNNPLERARDWAQIAPEWGLAGNAAFIAAPRSLSKGVDLEGRVFLHSYDYSQDSEWKVLEMIITAPLVVAQWINMQYYLSTVDNAKFGSGSKVLHNVIGDFGVMQGAASDLKIGLPLQSIITADALRHEPMRLLAIIRAPMRAIDEVLSKHPEVGQLVSNRWIRLVSLDPTSSAFFEALDCGKWQQINPRQIGRKKSEPVETVANQAKSQLFALDGNVVDLFAEVRST